MIHYIYHPFWGKKKSQPDLRETKHCVSVELGLLMNVIAINICIFLKTMLLEVQLPP